MGKAILLLLFLPPLALAQADPTAFTLEALPIGHSVTLPKPAKTYVSMKNRVHLTSTDSAQTVKLQTISRKGGKPKQIKLAIYDRKSERVKYIHLNPETPYLYSFRGLSTVALVPDTAADIDEDTRLEIESDKPLEIAR